MQVQSEIMELRPRVLIGQEQNPVPSQQTWSNYEELSPQQTRANATQSKNGIIGCSYRYIEVFCSETRRQKAAEAKVKELTSESETEGKVYQSIHPRMTDP